MSRASASVLAGASCRPTCGVRPRWPRCCPSCTCAGSLPAISAPHSRGCWARTQLGCRRPTSHFRSHDRLQKHVLVGVHNKREISSDCPFCRSNCDQDSAEGHRASFQSIIAEQKIIQSLTELLLNGQIVQPVNEAHSFCWETLSSLPELLS